MKIVLKPLFYTRLGEITFEDGDFLVGRFEEPFASCNEPFVAGLSRRHALIVVEKEAIYLIDLASLNGTKVNDRPVRGSVVTLQEGDKIRFAEQAIFQVTIKEKAKSAAPLPTSFHLVLAPASNHPGCEPIETTALPLLISAASGRWIGCGEQPLTLQQNETFHPQALLLLKDGQIYLTDVSHPSTTQVDGYALEGETVLLRDRVQVVLGEDREVYRVRIKKPATSKLGIDLQATTAVDTCEDETSSASETQPTKTFDVTKTTYVETATPFLDIFCHPEAQPEPANEIAEVAAPPDGQPIARGGPVGKIRAWKRQLGGLVAGKAAIGRRKLGWIAAIGLVLVGFGGYLYWREAAERHLKQLLEESQFAEAAQLASDYLRTHPDNETVRALGTEALIKYAVPYWMKNIEEKEYTEADTTLDNARSQTQFNVGGQNILELLKWVSDLEKFDAERGGMSLTIFRNEGQMQELIKRWEDDVNEHNHLLGMIARYEPGFEGLRSRTFTRLRTIQNEASIYLRAIESLKATIIQKLQADHPEELKPIFKDFVAKYPSIGGIETLNKDLDGYLKLREAIRTQNVAEAERLSNNKSFATPPFRDKADEIAAKIDKKFIAAYQEAVSRWRAGKATEAMAMMDRLKGETWGQVAGLALERYKKTAADFKILRAILASGQCGQELFDFRRTLNRPDDTFFLDATEADFQRCKWKALEDARKSFKLAKQGWETYRENGGIMGRLRLETSLSEAFRQQAKRLADACNDAARAARVYDDLNLPYPDPWRELYEQVLNEMKLQRQSLNDLNSIIDPVLLKRKLDLLPMPQKGASS